MKKKIIILGSTGELGSKLLKSIDLSYYEIFASTCFTNKTKIKRQQIKYNIRHIFCLSDEFHYKKFLDLLKNKIDIIYFLDFGSYSLIYLDKFLKFNKKSIVAIANKEMIIAGGFFLVNKLKKTQNKLIPLDSEHFSLINSNIHNKKIDRVYITASGGPFYFKKNKDFNKVSFKEVINHPKWKMGINNSIDSSNFVNKVLEMIELSIIFNIDIEKIDFLLSKEAFIHSLIIYGSSTISVNAFKNDMLIPLLEPLGTSNRIKFNSYDLNSIFKLTNFKLEKYNDNRFKIIKYIPLIKSFNQSGHINFMLLNNIAQRLYINKKLNYNKIVNFIIYNVKKETNNKKFKSFDSILDYIKSINNKYEKIFF